MKDLLAIDGQQSRQNTLRQTSTKYNDLKFFKFQFDSSILVLCLSTDIIFFIHDISDMYKG